MKINAFESVKKKGTQKGLAFGKPRGKPFVALLCFHLRNGGEG
jgi:hypothetical protein